MELSEKDEEYIISLLKQEKKLNAVEFVKEKAGVSLLEAKQYIDEKINNEYYEKNVSISKEDEKYISSLIKENKKLQAIAFLHKEKEMTLTDAKSYVDREKFKVEISTKKNPNKKVYIFDEKLNIFIPDLAKQRKITKMALNILLILIPISLIQLYFFDRTSYIKILILGFCMMFISTFLIIWIGVKINIYIIEKRLKEFENLELLNEFEIKSLRKNFYIFSFILFFVFLIFGLYINIEKLIKELSYKYIFHTIFLLGMIIYVCYEFLKELKNRKYSLNISGKTIRILYKNNEINSIKVDEINFIKFYAKKFKNKVITAIPVIQIFDREKNIFVEMTLKTIDYYLLKMYCSKYNVLTNDEFNKL